MNRLDHTRLGFNQGWCAFMHVDCGVFGQRPASVYYSRLHKTGDAASVRVHYVTVHLNERHWVEWTPPQDVRQSIEFRIEEDLDNYEMPDAFPPEQGAELEDMG